MRIKQASVGNQQNDFGVSFAQNFEKKFLERWGLERYNNPASHARPHDW